MNRQYRFLFSAAVMLSAALVVPDSRAAGTLVAHYEFEDPDDLGHDSSGMGNHGTTVTNVTAVEGWSGGAAFFDESMPSTFTKAGGLTGFSGQTGQTFAAWVKLDAATNQFDGIISQDSGGCCQTRILLHPDNKPFINLSEHSDRHLAGAPSFQIDEWTHIVMTGENIGGGAEARVYVNGVEVPGSPQAFPLTEDASSWNTYLGVGESGTAHRLTGALDDVRIYEGVLTEAEIQELLDPVTVAFRFTEIIYDSVNDTFRLTWTSRASRSYGLFLSTDLADFSLELDDGIPSAGDTTTYPPPEQAPLDNPMPGAPRIFFRVEEIP